MDRCSRFADDVPSVRQAATIHVRFPRLPTSGNCEQKPPPYSKRHQVKPAANPNGHWLQFKMFIRLTDTNELNCKKQRLLASSSTEVVTVAIKCREAKSVFLPGHMAVSPHSILESFGSYTLAIQPARPGLCA